MTLANAAILFEPEGYTTTRPRLMGRQAAGEGFLKAFLRRAEVDVLYCCCRSREQAEQFARLRDEHAHRRIPVRWIPYGDPAALAVPGTLYLPGPGLADFAWRRRRVGSRVFSLCGVTHTLASQAAMDAIAHLVSGPVEPWDALVCTSQVVLDAVKRLLAAEADYLRERLGAHRFPQPELALIPLGVDCEAFAPDAAARAGWRQRLGIGEDDVAFLFVGRLSFHAKANPLPMYLALEQAARRSRRRAHLIQAGWFHNEGIRREFMAGAKALCPSVNAIFLDGREPEVRAGIWHAGDVFVSLSDNVQETFGLAPLEAMAAGLPCVVSDWDGYRETVRDGIDGYRIPTLAPPPASGRRLAERHEDEIDTYDRYIGYASLAVSVDTPACIEACTKLAGDPALRRKMGQAGRARACAEFDWPVILRRYQQLWQVLAERRSAAPPGEPPALPNPRRSDPFWLFAEYPTRTLGPADRLVAAPDAGTKRLAELRGLGLVNYGAAVLPDAKVCAGLLERIIAHPGTRVRDLLADHRPEDGPALLRAIMWLNKLDLVRVQR